MVAETDDRTSGPGTPDPAPLEDRTDRPGPTEGLVHRRILAVVNPVSGMFPFERTVRELKDRAAQMGIELDVVLTRKDLDGEEAVRSRPERYDCYLAAGGDGTVMEVAGAAMRDGVPLAILPRGTANAVAWHFRIPIDAGQALKVASRGRLLQVDIARTPQRDFLIMAGLGYDAHVIEGATRKLKRRLGFLAYLYGAIKGLGRSPHVFRVHLDDREAMRVTGAAAMVLNTGTLAGNLRVVRNVSPRDGLLDLVVVSPENFGALFRMAFWGLLGRLNEDPRVRYYQAKRIRLECRPSALLEIDGDLMGTQRDFQVEVVPRALSLMVLSRGIPWLPIPDRLWAGGGAFPWAKDRPYVPEKGEEVLEHTHDP
jgi:YegS/Rv2252/BmrU family lipid kinase